MSNVIRNGLEHVRKSEFIFGDRGGLEIRDAYIFWTNFRGEKNKFDNATRNFNVAVTPEVGTLLLSKGWRVRERPLLDSDDSVIDTLFFINVKVNMQTAYPPIISLYSEFRGNRSKRALDIETIGELDRLDIQRFDIIINAYTSDKFPGKVTGYLNKLNAIQEPNIEFGGKYDDWLHDEEDCIADGTCSLSE